MDFKIKVPDLSGAKALLEGAMANIDPLLKDDKVFVTLAEALILAKQIHARIESKLESMTLHVTLAIPPGVSVDFT